MQGRDRARSAALVAAVVAYLGLCAATASVWEPAHDEGVTWDQAIAPLAIPSFPDPPVALDSLTPTLEAQVPFSAAGIVDRLMAEGGMHPPAYYWVFGAWSRLVGTGRMLVSVPVLALCALALVVLSRLASVMAPSGAGGTSSFVSLATASLAVSPWFVNFSIYARPYAAALAIAVLATAAAYRAADARGGWRPLALFVLLSLLGIYTLYHYAFVLLWHAGFLLACALSTPGWPGRRAALARISCAGGLIVLGYLPWFGRFRSHLELTGGTPYYFSGVLLPAEWAASGLDALRFFGLAEMHRSVVLGWAFSGLATATALLALWSFRPARWHALEPRLRWLWLCALLLPAGLAAGDSWHGTHTLFMTKTSFALLLLFVLLAQRAANEIRRARFSWLFAGGWIALGLAASLANVGERGREPTHFERVAGHLAETDSERHWIVVSSKRRGYLVPLMLALRDAGLGKVRVLHTPGPALPALLRQLAASTEVERVSLLNLADFYTSDGMWKQAEMDRARHVAEGEGFQVQPLAAGAAKFRGGQSGPIVSIGLPLQVKYFSM